MAGFSTNIREDMLQWAGNIGALPTRPNDFHIQWHSGDPGTTGGDNISVGLTARDPLSGTPEWALGTGEDGVIENSTAAETVLAGATDTITHFSIWSSGTDGDYYWSGALTASKNIDSGDKLTWGSGDLTVTIT